MADVRIISGLTTAQTVSDHELFFARRALQLLKSRLGTQAISDLLVDDTAKADLWWENKVVESHNKWRPASVTLTTEGITTEQFLAWFKQHVADMPVMQAAHPEHYINGTTVLETIGEHVSLFNLRFSEKPDPCVRNYDPERYPIVLCASGVLRSGTVIGHACHQFRTWDDGKGFEACFSGWIPEAVGEDVAEMQRRHLAVEWSNWIKAAKEDMSRDSKE